jgi:hypothetical protein
MRGWHGAHASCLTGGAPPSASPHAVGAVRA